MVALIDNHVAVRRYAVIYPVLSVEALERGDVQAAIRLAFAAADLTDLFGLQVEKHR